MPLREIAKFSKPDSAVELHIDHHDNGSLALAIEDHGIGIAADDLGKVLEPFMQADSSFNRRYEGIGVELTLAKRLIENHGGALGIKSEFGIGTTVTITIPSTRISYHAAS